MVIAWNVPQPACREKGPGIRDLAQNSAQQKGLMLLVEISDELPAAVLGDPLRVAQQRAYAALESIEFDGMQWRRDIGHRAFKAR